jgi:hypothetical protein
VATYYIDFDGGNDASAGTSFATRWKTITLGATAVRIAPGDEIRIMASPDPTSIGSATWTGGGRPAAINISSSTNATPIVVTSSAAHGLATGDYVSIISHTTNTNANGVWLVGTTPTSTTFQILQIDGSNTTGNGVGGATGRITNANNLVVKTASPLVQNIAVCGGLGENPAWTPSASVTTAQNVSLYKEGYSAAQINILVAFTTGKAAYYTLPSTLDLSAYQQVTFWIRQISGTVSAAGQVYVALCSDTTGDTVVHQCDVPALGATNAWVPVTVDLGVNLNSAIQSVAFYVVTDTGARNFIIDNIVACKAAASVDSVTLSSLVSKSDGTGDEAWYAMQSINNDVIMLANANTNTSQSTSIKGYNGVTETVTTYKRETTKTVPAASVSATVAAVNDNGTSGNLITYSGGWNRTDMSTQTGFTWYDGSSGNGMGLQASAKTYVEIDRLNFCRYNVGLQLTSTTNNTNVVSAYATANSNNGIELGSSTYVINCTALWGNNNGIDGIAVGGTGSVIADIKLADNNTQDGLSLTSAQYATVGSVVGGNNGTSTAHAGISFNTCFNCTIGTATLTNNTVSPAVGVSVTINCSINGGSTSGNFSGVVVSRPAELYLNNFTINESSEIVSTGVAGFVYSNRHDDTDNNSQVFQPGIGTVNQTTAIVDSPATTSWRMRPSSSVATANSPVLLKLGTVVCAANSLVTVTARMQRQGSSLLTMRLVCPGGQISGVDTDVFADATGALNVWETVTITFTPTKAGGVDIFAQAFGGTAFSGYVCNLTASQA